MPYSLDLRRRVVSAVHGGMKKTEVYKLFSICKYTLYSWLELERTTGNLEPHTGFQKGHSHGIKDVEEFKEFVDAHPDYTQKEMGQHYGVGKSTIGRCLKKIGYSRKKRAKLTPNAVKKNEKPT
ncbi:MAG: IS630 transposase-related protein [Legionella sp.]|uniref:IS630 transposase-related protein n=1 Tax=Legionella sp. TaxID=459 RepID=UPI0039E3880F